MLLKGLEERSLAIWMCPLDRTNLSLGINMFDFLKIRNNKNEVKVIAMLLNKYVLLFMLFHKKETRNRQTLNIKPIHTLQLVQLINLM